jgi:hypothetical protein
MYGPKNQLTITVMALPTISMDIFHTVLKKTKSQNTSVKYACILAKQIPFLTIPTVAVKQWFKQQQAIL